MKMIRVFALALTLSALAAPLAIANYRYRQYYDTSWSYNPSYSYYYVTYYYQPVVTQTSYNYHYCIYYPSQPRYVYYYNPVSQVYWGRYEIGSKGEKRYSILADKDRKKDLKEIPKKPSRSRRRCPRSRKRRTASQWSLRRKMSRRTRSNSACSIKRSPLRATRGESVCAHQSQRVGTFAAL